VHVRRSLYRLLGRTDLFNRALRARVAKLIAKTDLRVYLFSGGKYLDIGAGSGDLAAMLEESSAATFYEMDTQDWRREEIRLRRGHSVQRRIASPAEKPLRCGNFCIAAGEAVPIKDNTLDGISIFGVLHHTKDPEHILCEALRAVKPEGKILLYEDTYNNKWQEWKTKLLDSIGNLEFIGHPHSNKTLAEWKDLFNKYPIRIIAEKSFAFTGFQISFFVLQKNRF
jgi:ubiquinone/menaquinone biosynthesis C-methylase UbiE